MTKRYETKLSLPSPHTSTSRGYMAGVNIINMSHLWAPVQNGFKISLDLSFSKKKKKKEWAKTFTTRIQLKADQFFKKLQTNLIMMEHKT